MANGCYSPLVGQWFISEDQDLFWALSTYVGCELKEVRSPVGFPMFTHCGSSNVLPSALKSMSVFVFSFFFEFFQSVQNLPEMASNVARSFFVPTNPDLADILGRMDFDFEIFFGGEGGGSQVS